MSTTLYDRIYEVVRHISPGRVATYGQVATVVGAAVSAREVGEAMAALRDGQPEPPVPWQRWPRRVSSTPVPRPTCRGPAACSMRSLR